MLAWYDRVLDAFGWLAALMIVFIGAGVSLDVCLRYFGAPTIPWMLEASEYALYLMTFFGAPWALREGAHVRIDIAVRALPAKGQHMAALAVKVIGLAIALVLAVYAVRITQASWARGAMIYQELVFPEWWLLALLPVALALVALEFLRQLLGKQ